MTESETQSLLKEYLFAVRFGAFPMGVTDSNRGVGWYLPKRRGILPLGEFRMPRRLKRTIRRHQFIATVDRDFDLVIRNCANRRSVWINDSIIDLFHELHRIGIAHSVEVRLENELVGGLYGAGIGAAFCGESMYSSFPCASQIALMHLVDRLQAGGFQLLDVQFKTEHLKRFGVTEVSGSTYQQLLDSAAEADASFYSRPSIESSTSVLQRMSHTS